MHYAPPRSAQLFAAIRDGRILKAGRRARAADPKPEQLDQGDR